MKPKRFYPHSIACSDTGCHGACARLREDDNGSVVRHEEFERFSALGVGDFLVQKLRDDGCIQVVSCIWEDLAPSFTIQLETDCCPDRALLLLEALAGLRVPVRFVTHQGSDCPGRRIY